MQITDVTVNGFGEYMGIENFDFEKIINQTPKNRKDVIDFNSRQILETPEKKPVKFFSWFYQDDF